MSFRFNSFPLKIAKDKEENGKEEGEGTKHWFGFKKY